MLRKKVRHWDRVFCVSRTLPDNPTGFGGSGHGPDRIWELSDGLVIRYDK